MFTLGSYLLFMPTSGVFTVLAFFPNLVEAPSNLINWLQLGTLYAAAIIPINLTTIYWFAVNPFDYNYTPKRSFLGSWIDHVLQLILRIRREIDLSIYSIDNYAFYRKLKSTSQSIQTIKKSFEKYEQERLIKLKSVLVRRRIITTFLIIVNLITFTSLILSIFLYNQIFIAQERIESIQIRSEEVIGYRISGSSEGPDPWLRSYDTSCMPQFVEKVAECNQITLQLEEQNAILEQYNGLTNIFASIGLFGFLITQVLALITIKRRKGERATYFSLVKSIQSYIEQVRSAFKENIITAFVGVIKNDDSVKYLEYEYGEKDLNETLKSIGLLPKALMNYTKNNHVSSDRLYGKYNDIKFGVYDYAIIAQSDESRERTNRNSLILIETEFKERFAGEVSIVTTTGLYELQRFYNFRASKLPNKLETESIDFNNQFDVSATDQIEGRLALKTNIMENMLQLAAIHNGLYFMFKDNKAYLIIDTKEDMFEIDYLNSSANSFDKVSNSFVFDLLLPLQIIEELNPRVFG